MMYVDYHWLVIMDYSGSRVIKIRLDRRKRAALEECDKKGSADDFILEMSRHYNFRPSDCHHMFCVDLKEETYA